MSATDELRALLDEFGVEWDFGPSGAFSTAFRVSGVELSFEDWRHGLMCSTILTPAQVIATTLGRGECHIEEDEDTGFLCCSECGAIQPEDFTVYFCWCCGRKVVSA